MQSTDKVYVTDIQSLLNRLARPRYSQLTGDARFKAYIDNLKGGQTQDFFLWMGMAEFLVSMLLTPEGKKVEGKEGKKENSLQIWDGRALMRNYQSEFAPGLKAVVSACQGQTEIVILDLNILRVYFALLNGMQLQAGIYIVHFDHPPSLLGDYSFSPDE